MELSLSSSQIKLEQSDQFLTEALLAVSSAEEYAAKIHALQKACLRPLKEDLADWLNKIMSSTTITSDNFMHKLDNGVIICKLAKIISRWCLEREQAQLDNLKDRDRDVNYNDQSSTEKQYLHYNKMPQVNHYEDAKQIVGYPYNQAQTSRIASNQVTRNKVYPKSRLAASTINVNNPNGDTCSKVKCTDLYRNAHDLNTKESIPFAIVSPIGRPTTRKTLRGSSRCISQSTNCLINQSSTGNGYGDRPNSFMINHKHFIDNLIHMDQTKIWEEARCRTFYARDNVCNFIKWSRQFGVNQSVLFESDDLVLHANPRQVVLCLLDVARIAYVKYAFEESPGLVKFEQEIDVKRMSSLARSIQQDDEFIGTLNGRFKHDKSTILSDRKQLKCVRNTKNIGDATDQLILRYCQHKQEQAARDKADAEIAALAASIKAAELYANPDVDDDDHTKTANHDTNDDHHVPDLDEKKLIDHQIINKKESISNNCDENNHVIDDNSEHNLKISDHDNNTFDTILQSENCNMTEQLDNTQKELLITNDSTDRSNYSITNTNDIEQKDGDRDGDQDQDQEQQQDKKNERRISTPEMTCQTPVSKSAQQRLTSFSTSKIPTLMKQYERNDSLDSGEGQSESASTSQTSRTRADSTSARSATRVGSSSIPTLIRLTNSSLSLTSDPTTSLSTSDDLSSSRSSLLSNNEASSSKDHDPMDLDGKVMRIAKSYYGKGAKRGVTRLSEGKYKIADRIVFVRLLKGHRVMVRIGGGWDTLENFLFRHKSDPSQVIDVDNLLPLETK